MKLLHPLLLGAALAVPGLLPAKITRVVEKTFAVQPGGKLDASTQGGDIIVKAGEGNDVRVKAVQVVRASTEQEADQILAKLDLRIEQSGNDVRAEAKYEKQGKGKWFGSWPPVSVSFEVTVPSHYNLQLNTSGGDVRVASLRGNVRARTSGGDLEFARIEGDIDAGTSGGDIKLAEGTARARLTTSGGDIRVERAGGPTEASTSGGDITLDSVAQLISASTSGGNVRATLAEAPKQDASLSTSGGDIEVRISSGAAFRLDASTSGGNVRADGLTITLKEGGKGKNHLVGAVNGGGPTLRLRSSGGDVRIRQN
jgi:hypothetical protein